MTTIHARILADHAAALDGGTPTGARDSVTVHALAGAIDAINMSDSSGICRRPLTDHETVPVLRGSPATQSRVDPDLSDRLVGMTHR